jgi:lipoprotein NlpD
MMTQSKFTTRTRAGKWLALLLACAALAACSSPRRIPAPVEERGSARHGAVVGEAPRTTPLPGAENAGRTGYFTVRPGDTLIRIALESGQNWRDIARWNNLDNPNVIEVGQVLRVLPPTATAAAPAASSAPSVSASAASSVARGTGTTVPVPAASSAAAGEEEIAWLWPTPGGTPVLATFDDQKNKGIDIGGRAGDPVLASADGRVVYAGAGLRGYGNLIILKHNNTYLTAYAHNQALLVKEDQSVRKGQKIAEMGSTDSDRVKLHFEIRRQGKPVDPTRYLPVR